MHSTDLVISICDHCKQRYEHLDSEGITGYIGCRKCRFNKMRRLFRERGNDESLKSIQHKFESDFSNYKNRTNFKCKHQAF